jgi:hypothetical protein
MLRSGSTPTRVYNLLKYVIEQELVSDQDNKYGGSRLDTKLRVIPACRSKMRIKLRM